MQLLAFTDLIILPSRQRQTFDEDKLMELAESIKDKGIMHPPVVRNDGKTLVAGERRSKAMAYLSHLKIPFHCNGTLIAPGFMPVTLIGELTPLQIREAELEENLCRVDLSWQEEALAIAELTALRQEQNPDWVMKDTARELDKTEAEPAGLTYEKVRDAEILKNYMDDPDVLKAKNSRDAVKIIRKKVQQKTNAMLASVHKASDTPHTILNQDVREALPALPDNTFAVLLTDPPYGVGADNFGGQAKAEHAYDDSPEYAMELIRFVATEGYRVTCREAHAYVFCDIRMWPLFCTEFAAAGWDVWNTPLIWVKSNGMLPRPEHGPRRCYETIMYAIKGNKKVNAVHPDVLMVQEVNRPTFGAEKPPALYRNLLKRSVVPGDKVLDCFAGAGPMLPAANACDVTATVVELNVDKYNHMLLRVDEDMQDATLADLI